MQERADFQQILSSPTEAYEEGLRFFMGKSLLNNALRRIASDLEAQARARGVLPETLVNLWLAERLQEER